MGGEAIPIVDCIIGCFIACELGCLICQYNCIPSCDPFNPPTDSGPTSTPGDGATPPADTQPPVSSDQPIPCQYEGQIPTCPNAGLPTPPPVVPPIIPLPGVKCVIGAIASPVAKTIAGALTGPSAGANAANSRTTQGNVGSALGSTGNNMLAGGTGGSGAIPTPLQSPALAGAAVSGAAPNILSPLQQLRVPTEQPTSVVDPTVAATNLRVGDPTGIPVQSSYVAPYEVPEAAEGGYQPDIIQRFQDQSTRNRSGALMNSGLKLLSGQKAGGAQHEEHQEHGEHVPEFVTGATGHYVKGKGDGQSDDIPAMLADGEYVFDADTVAALGNGSSDAGAKLLDHFRESLREHKRSASSDKIPPKASPLAYMKEALKRHSKG